MTTQAMTLSLEQQAKQLRQSQALALAPAPAPAPAAALAPATAPAPAPRAASPTSPPPAITHKPKKTPTHQKEPESGLELVGARLTVRSQGWGDGRAWDGQLASRLQTWETGGWGWGRRAMQKRCCPASAPQVRVRALCERQLGQQGCSFCSPSCQQEAPQEAEDRHPRPRSFQQKRDYFQKLGEHPWEGNQTQRLRHRPRLARGQGAALWSGWPVQEPNVLSRSVVCNSS